MRLLFVLLLLPFGLWNTYAQNCSKTKLVVEKLIANHLEPLSINDTLSTRIFEQAFKGFDPEGLFFTAPDIKRLEKYRYNIDDQIFSGLCTFEVDFKKALLLKILKAKARIDSLLMKNLAFNAQDWQPLMIKKTVAQNTEADLVNYTLRILKAEVLNRSFQKQRLTDTTKLTLASLEKLLWQTQQKVKLDYVNMLDRLNTEMSKAEIFQAEYLKFVASSFDPHSTYFTTKAKKAFDEALSDDRLSLGINLEEDAFGRVVVAGLVPGGPAWKSGQVHVGDTPVSLTWDGEQQIDCIELSAVEVERVLHKQGATKATLTLLRKTGDRVTINLAKEKIENTENTVAGFLLNGIHRIGYIHLPGFFTDEDGGGAKGCANEVAKQILTLNRQKIEGLILDLRGNSGGSMVEAVDLAGTFIDVGPMTIVSERNSKPESIKDLNRGVAYAGPLVVLVDGLSASASELVAAALQDYNRAIIVGSKTFGKATGQAIYPLNDSETDFIKVTVGRLYRITQKSLQHEGVNPDILIPQIGAPLLESERDQDYSIKPKIVDKKAYFTLFPLPDYETLRKRSTGRLDKSLGVASIKRLNKVLTDGIPLRLDDYVNFTAKLDLEYQTLRHPAQKAPFSVVSNGLEDLGTTVLNSTLESFKKEIQASPYVQEAFHVICDVIDAKIK